MMTFPIMKIINTELFIDRTVTLYIEETRRAVTKEGNQPVGTSWLEERVCLAQKCYLWLKRVGIKDQMSTYLEMSLTGMKWKLTVEFKALWLSFFNISVAKINVVSGFERTNSLPENQSVCLNLWVSISPIIIKSSDGPWPDPTRAYFWSAVNKRLTHLWPGYFWTQPEDIFFWPEGKKNWKFLYF